MAKYCVGKMCVLVSGHTSSMWVHHHYKNHQKHLVVSICSNKISSIVSKHTGSALNPRLHPPVKRYITIKLHLVPHQFECHRDSRQFAINACVAIFSSCSFQVFEHLPAHFTANKAGYVGLVYAVVGNQLYTDADKAAGCMPVCMFALACMSIV